MNPASAYGIIIESWTLQKQGWFRQRMAKNIYKSDNLSPNRNVIAF